LFKVFLWYRASMLEGAHPMITGFLRRKRRVERRPGLPLEGRVLFARKRIAETWSTCRGYVRLAFEMQELWLRTRIRRRDYSRWAALHGFVTRAGTPSHIKLGWGRVHAELAAQLDALGARGRYARKHLTATMHNRLEAIREALDGHVTPAPFSSDLASLVNKVAPTRRRPWRFYPARLTWNLARDVRNMLVFLAAVVTERY
jgi:hypothetical protein